jgi:two-component system NtrC family sensor kinase
MNTAPQPLLGLAKYREIIISVALFLVFDLGVLVLNFVISSDFEQDAIGINLSGRQRMLSQRTVKTVLQIETHQRAGKSIAEPQKELSLSYNLFDATLEGFNSGRMVTGGDGVPVFLKAVETDSAKSYVRQAITIWSAYKEKLAPVLAARDSVSDEKLQAAIAFATVNNLKLLGLMNNLTSELENISNARAKTLRLIQTIAIVLALGNFVLVIFHFLRKLRQQDSQIAEYSEGLESLVSKQTGELQASNAELEKFVQNLENMVSKRTMQLKDSQAQLIQSEKMASLGQMVAGLAHEINTPLGYVRNNVVSLKEVQTEMRMLVEQFMVTQNILLTGEFDDLENVLFKNKTVLDEVNVKFYNQADGLFTDSLDGLDRIKDLILNLKNFSRLDEAQMKEADINASLDATLKIANNVIKHRVTVTKNYGTLPPVRCYPAQLNQVFLNLITNAAQACERQNQPDYKGKLTITTSMQNNMAVIEVADNGSGIAPKNLSKIFEPFFTTKPIGQGTGLGLSIVYKIIEQHGGKISVDSKVGSGTTFKIELPLLTEAKQPTTLFADDKHNAILATQNSLQ